MPPSPPTFPFGIFKAGAPRRGHYSGAARDPVAEASFVEHDPDAPYDEKLAWDEDPGKMQEYEHCWHDRIWKGGEPMPGLELWAIAQSHMDIAWLWRMHQIAGKARITHGKAAFHVLRLSDFKFTFSQPVMLEWLQAIHPATFDEVRRAIATGRFELQGGDYVECDGKIPSGESFCRQRLYGQRYYLDTFGKIASVGWLPDSFGYNNNIPQFLVKSGCKHFYTQKISGNWPPHAFPFAHFAWRSPDGSEVVVYSNNFAFRPLTRWVLFGRHRRLLRPGTSLACDYRHPDPASAPELGEPWPVVGLVFGTGDGGHGPTCEEVHRMRHFIKDGRVKGFLTAAEYFAMYEPVRDRLPVWDGAELYYNLHRGTLTTQGLVKRMNRHFEWTATGLQALFSLQALVRGGSTDPAIHAMLTRLWKDTLLLQFHDILPGSSVPEVYDDCHDIWMDDAVMVRELVGLLLGGAEPAALHGEVVVANPTAYAGVVPVEIPVPAGGAAPRDLALVDGSGRRWPCQPVDAETFDEPLLDRPARLLACFPVEPWAVTTAAIARDVVPSGDPPVSVVESEDLVVLESDRVRVAVSRRTGDVTSIVDKSGAGELLAGPASIRAYRDWFTIERAWNIGPGYKECPFEADELVLSSVQVIERGPARWAIEVVHGMPESGSSVTQRVQVHPGLDGVFFDLAIDWHQQHAILKHRFPIAFTPDQAIAEGPYTTENVTADPAARSHLDAQRWENCWHAWLAVPAVDDARGIAFINDSKYGFDIDKNDVGLTLLRGPDYPGATGYVLEERAARTDGGPPVFTDHGKHLVRHAIVPYRGPWATAGFKTLARAINRPPIVLPVRAGDPTCVTFHPGIRVTPANLELVAAKDPEPGAACDGGTILRVVETGRQHVTGTITFPASLRVASVSLVDLVEREMSPAQLPITLERDGDAITACTLAWRPHEIHSLLVRTRPRPA